MIERISILVTSAGRRSQLLDCIRADAKKLGYKLTLLAADLNPEMSPASRLADKAISVPRCTNPEYIDRLLEICSSEKVTLLIPTIDTELKILSANRSKFQAIGTYIGISELDLVRLAQDKLRTARELDKLGIPTPRTASLGEFDSQDPSWKWPLIFKPNSGSNSQGIYRVDTPKDYPKLTSETDYIVQECIQGIVYTINCYFDKQGKLLASVPHERIEVRGGEVSKGVTRKIEALDIVARKIANAYQGWRGPICFQAIKPQDDDYYYVFEINARFGGGFPIAHQAGAPFTRWLIQESIAEVPGPVTDWQENLTMLRYENAVFFND